MTGTMVRLPDWMSEGHKVKAKEGTIDLKKGKIYTIDKVRLLPNNALEFMLKEIHGIYFYHGIFDHVCNGIDRAIERLND